MAARAQRRPDSALEELIWEPQPRQAAFIGCPADDVGFGGARGGGKSDAVCGDFIDHEETYGEHAIAMAFRRERTQLTELIERARQILSPLGYRWHEQEKYFRGPKCGRLRFAYLENDSDADAYQGHSYTRLYAEEMGTFPNEGPINKLMATLRSGHGVPCQLKGTCNPGGPGHQWVKARYNLAGRVNEVIRQDFVFDNPFTKKKIAKTRVFIPSRVTDNKFLGDDYVANLYQVGSRELVEAWLNGDWDVVLGAFFDCWSAARHVIAPFAIPPDWLRYRCLDWGFASPFASYWIAVAGDDRVHDGATIPRGALVAYREWYGCDRPNIGIRLTAEQVAHGIAERERADGDVRFGVLDPRAFANDAGGPTPAERINGVLIANQRSIFRRAENRRVPDAGHIGGWDAMRTRLIGKDGRPMLYFFSTCVHAIRTIPALQHDPDRPEDLDTESEDHAADAVRYGCMARPWIAAVAPPEANRSELEFRVDDDGILRANMDVKDWVAARLRKKKANGY